MIQKETQLQVIDNSGALVVKCFLIYGGSFVRSAVVGNTILVSFQKIKPHLKLKTKVIKAIITTTKKWTRRTNGHYLRSFSNSVILLKDDATLLGNKNFRPVFSEVFFKNIVTFGSKLRRLV